MKRRSSLSADHPRGPAVTESFKDDDCGRFRHHNSGLQKHSSFYVCIKFLLPALPSPEPYDVFQYWLWRVSAGRARGQDLRAAHPAAGSDLQRQQTVRADVWTWFANMSIFGKLTYHLHVKRRFLIVVSNPPPTHPPTETVQEAVVHQRRGGP